MSHYFTFFLAFFSFRHHINRVRENFVCEMRSSYHLERRKIDNCWVSDVHLLIFIMRNFSPLHVTPSERNEMILLLCVDIILCVASLDRVLKFLRVEKESERFSIDLNKI
jgi:hypothetical protein